MRPPEFTGGNELPVVVIDPFGFLASMRPPEFTGGNGKSSAVRYCLPQNASMRPPEFTGGNRIVCTPVRIHLDGFNEAAGIHRRKPRNRQSEP